MNYFIGVDIGGTKTAIGLVTMDGEVRDKKVLPTDQSLPPFQMIDRITTSIEELVEVNNISVSQVVGLGIGAPGPLDAVEGMLTCPPNLPDWKAIPIVKKLKEKFPFPIYFQNDASAAALGEKWLGAAQGATNFLYMTISTGIGAGIVIDGKLYTGTRGNAGDIGHMVVDPSYGTCTCGQEGCLEWIASGTAISRLGSEVAGKQLTTAEVFKLYDDGYEKIVPMMEKVFTRLGMGCVSLINTFEPEMIVFGGGVSKVGETLLTPVNDYISNYALGPVGRNTKVVQAKLKDDIGIIGAAALVKHSLK